MRVQLVPRRGNRPKVKAMEAELVRTCPLPLEVVAVPEHGSNVLLVMYGAGSLDGTALLNQHRKSGGRVLCFDRGYFGRASIAMQEHYRASIDELHVSPPYLEATTDNGKRFSRFQISLREDATPEGPVIVAGLGPKSRIGLGLPNWDQGTLEATQRRFPRRRVIYRPKNRLKVRWPNAVRWRWVNTTGQIEDVLRGASLAVVRHSNVAVDACIAGVPVECEDGAARWLYSSGSVQNVERRTSFLHRLAWWNWRADEMAGAWKFLLPQVGA